MANTVTNLVSFVRQRVDAVGSDAFSDSDIQTALRMTAFELYELLLSTQGEDYYATYSQFTVTNSSETVYTFGTTADSFPPMKLLRVEWLRDDGKWHQMRKIDSNDPRDTTRLNWEEREPKWMLRRSMNAGNPTLLFFYPYTKNSETLRVHYIPQDSFAWFSTGSTVLPDWMDQWFLYLVMGAVVHLLDRLESDTSVALSQKATIASLITRSRANDTAGYSTIRDVRDYADGDEDVSWRII